MALKLKGSTSGFVGLDAPAVAGNNTLILPENSGSAFQLFGNDITAGVTTFTQVTVSRNGDLTVPGTISIGGTLTYEDVTSVDSVGVVTARGLSIFGNTSGLSVTGVSTFAGDVNITNNLPQIYLTDSNSSNARARINANGGNLLLGADNDNASADSVIYFEIDGSEKLRILSDGKMGLGTNSPQRLLHLSSNNTVFALTDTAASTDQKTKYILSDAGAFAFGKLSDDYGTATEQFRIGNSGNIGIGENSPLAKLHIKVADSGASAYAHTALVVEDSDHTFIDVMSGTSGSGGINFGDSGNAQRGVVEYNHSSDYMRFITAQGERLRISSNGDVRIGGGVPSTFGSGTTVFETYNASTYTANLVTSGTHQLQMIASQTHGATSIGTRSNHNLSLTTNDTARVTITSTGSDFYVADGETDIYSTGSGTQYSLRLLNSDATAGNRIGMYFGPANNVAGAYIRAHASEDFTSTAARDCGLELGVRHNGTFYEALDINSMGQQDNVSVTNAGTHFTFRNTTTSNTGTLLKVTSSRNTTNGSYYLAQWGSTSADRFTVLDSGNCANTNNSFSAISDQALKENIVDAGSQWDDIKNLKVRKFNFIETTDPDKKTMLGVVAQEAETVCPNLVETISTKQNGEENEFKTFKYSILYMKSVKALQEAMTRIESLEAEVAALKGS